MKDFPSVHHVVVQTGRGRPVCVQNCPHPSHQGEGKGRMRNNHSGS